MAPDLEAAKADLIRLSREWAAAAKSRDVERILSFWADDAIVLAPGQPALVGKAAIREFVRASLATPGFSITWEPEQARLSDAADMGYLIERNQVTFTDGDGGTHTGRGKAVTIWRKDAAGAWKCVVDSWNDNPRETVF
jgi:uncharacterized protein (TIGR02246 family)